MTREPITMAGEAITLGVISTFIASTTTLYAAIQHGVLAGPYAYAAGAAVVIFLTTFVAPRIVARWFGTTLHELWGTPP